MSAGVLAAVIGGTTLARDLLHPFPNVSLVGGTPVTALDAAATALEDAVAPSGAGFSFTVVTRSTLYAKPDGPKIEIPDPFDRYKTLGYGDEYYTGSAIAAGAVTPDGYWLQMRAGPAKDAAPDFENAEATLAALTTAKGTWRNDGEGWYRTDTPPGIGLDPATIALLPSLLRNGTDAKDDGTATLDGTNVAKVSAGGTITDAPGLMAIDAASFSELVAPIEYALDAQGRLVELHARMRNLRMETFDLIVDTVIRFDYGDPGPLPEPVPTLPPESPAPAPAAAN